VNARRQSRVPRIRGLMEATFAADQTVSDGKGARHSPSRKPAPAGGVNRDHESRRAAPRRMGGRVPRAAAAPRSAQLPRQPRRLRRALQVPR